MLMFDNIYIRGLFKKYREFYIFSKSIYLFMNIYFVPFKVIPLGYNTFMPTFFPILEALKKIIFCDLVQLLLRCRLYLLNRGVASSFHGPLQFWKQEKVTGGQVWGIRWLRHHYCVVFGQIFAHKQRCVSRGVIMVQKPVFVLPQIRAFLADCFAQIAHNLQVIFLIDRTTLWQELMMHHAPAIEENCEQNLHVRPNLARFFRSWLMRQLPLG